MELSYGVIELGFVFGVVLALAVWELVRVRREIRRDAEKPRNKGE
jgi:hypothetical protein